MTESCTVKHLQEKIDALTKENQVLRDACNLDRFNSNDHLILKLLINGANTNVSRKSSGYRHDEILKAFAAYLKIIGGKLTYQTLHANLPLVLPSLSTVNKYIQENRPFVVEGKLRLEDLHQYLIERNLPLRVSLSEDATRIQATVCYDSNTNQLVGFGLPLDENSIPMPFSFMARHTQEIKRHIQNTENVISSNVYIQMAQPISRIQPPFCLLLFLTDNTFKSENVMSRWNYTKEQLQEFGIIVDNFASDGDARYIKVMKMKSEIGVSDLSFFNCEWYSCGSSIDTTYTQDIVHIGTKCRNRLLKSSRMTPIGRKVISTAHLMYLIKTVSKDKHLLTRYDIEPKDRQNFNSVEKICSEKVCDSLLKYVPGCEGTAMFLKCLNYTLYSYLDTTMISAERIYKNWYGLFFFRVWRSWLIKSKFTLKESFISSNSYLCIELNAHSLVKQLLKLEQSDSYKFMPDLQGSQPCETMFRQARSFSSMNSTVVNFNMMEFINRLNKIQLQADIIKSYSDCIKFPRFEEKLQRHSTNQLQSPTVLSKNDIIKQIEKARTDVSKDIGKIGVDVSQLNFKCQINPTKFNEFDFDDFDCDDDDCDDNDDDDCDDGYDDNEETLDYLANIDGSDIEESCNVLNITGELEMRDYSTARISPDEEDRFTTVIDGSAKKKTVLKSGVVFVMLQDRCKLSSDRLRRVMERDFVREKSKDIENKSRYKI